MDSVEVWESFGLTLESYTHSILAHSYYLYVYMRAVQRERVIVPLQRGGKSS